MANVTKRQIVEAIARESGIPRRVVGPIVQHLLDKITAALSMGVDIELRNFGILKARVVAARVGRNPHVPGSRIPIPPRAAVRFTEGKVMRLRVTGVASKTQT